MKPRKTGRIKGVSFGKFQSARSQSNQDKKMHEQHMALLSRLKFEPDPQRIVSQVIAEIPPTDQVGFDPRFNLEKYARVIAVECMRRLKKGSTL